MKCNIRTEHFQLPIQEEISMCVCGPDVNAAI